VCTRFAHRLLRDGEGAHCWMDGWMDGWIHWSDTLLLRTFNVDFSFWEDMVARTFAIGCVYLIAWDGSRCDVICVAQ
jgi:hypothetical protein